MGGHRRHAHTGNQIHCQQSCIQDSQGAAMKDHKLEPHIRSFYHLAGNGIERKACQGTACFVARHLNPSRWHKALSQDARVYCLGKCYSAPASASETSRPRIESHARETITLSRMIHGGARSLAIYKSLGGYSALKQALAQSPDHIISEIEASGLRGRGGAGFPAGKKWRAVSNQSSDEKYVVANADEGDPGAYIDRFIIEDDPFCLIEALTIAGYATGARRGYVYLRSEYPQARLTLEQAIDEARREGLLGELLLQSHFSFDIELAIGNGSYVCGEETALLNSIEGRRPEVRPRPPYPTNQGLFDKPTLVNNV